MKSKGWLEFEILNKKPIELDILAMMHKGSDKGR